MRRGFYSRFGPAILAMSLLAAPLCIWSAGRVLATIDNEVVKWLPPQSASVRDFKEFQQSFGGGEVIAVSWPGCTLDDARLTQFAAALTGGGSVDGSAADRIFSQVLTGSDILKRMTDPPLRIERSEAVQRLKGIVIGPDLESTCVVVTPSEQRSSKSAVIFETIARAASVVEGLDPEELRIVGTPLFPLQMDQETNQLIRLAAWCGIVGMLLAWWHLRRLQYVLALFVTSLLITGVGMVILDISGIRMNALLILLPALWFVLSVSASVHLINYYRNACKQGEEGAVERAVLQGFAPCAMATMTTAIGLGTLMVSSLAPVRQFGFCGALGLVVGLIVLFLLLPASLQMWPGWLRRREDDFAHSRGFAQIIASTWEKLTTFLTRRHSTVVAGFVVLMVVLAVGVLRTKIAADQLDYFQPQSQLIRDFEWFETQIGPLVPIELSVRFSGETGPRNLIDRMEVILHIEQELGDLGPSATVFSAASLAPDIAPANSVRSATQRRIQGRRLENNRNEFVTAGYLTGETDRETWRITIRTGATSDTEYSRFLKEIQTRVNRVIADLAQDGVSGTDVSYTGLPLLSMRIRQDLWRVLTKSFMLSFFVISAVMAVTLRSLFVGILAMAPNVFPLLLSFGVMGWLGLALDIGAVMTISVALGIAVDDTFHFLISFRRGRLAGLSQADGIRSAYRDCGAAMVQTSLICGVSLLLFAFSGFVPASRFGVLMCLMLLSALLGDLILLPALLMGPAGRRFARPTSQSDVSQRESVPVS